MKISIIILMSSLQIIGANISVAQTNDPLAQNVERLNMRIDLAVETGREWPKHPGGLAAFLFDQDHTLQRGSIIFLDSISTHSDTSIWLEAILKRTSDRIWKIESIHECEESRAKEAFANRDHADNYIKKRGYFDPRNNGPLDVLSLLKTRQSPTWTPFFVQRFNWVKESDLPDLFELLDSTEPCANVQSMWSSHIDTTRSSIGNEAAYLIEGFRKDRYPPRLNSTRPLCDIEEIKLWWKERQGT
jgi:hypothetical protein